MHDFIEKHGACKFMAGGSDVMVDFKTTNRMPKYVISIARLTDHKYISIENGVLKVGALVTINEFEEFLQHNHQKAFDFFQ